MHPLLFLTAVMLIGDAHAYVGPGPGIAMIGPLFGLIGGVLVALAMMLAYPIRLLLKRRKSPKQ